MELPPELTRIPPGSLEVLRYMGQTATESTDMDSLAEGMGMSDRAVQRAIRGLVTQGYLNMDQDYVYFLTEKGGKAVQAIAAYDAEQPAGGDLSSMQRVVKQTVVVVLRNPLSAHDRSILQIGMVGAASVEEKCSLVLRFSVTSGSVAPSEVTLELEPRQPPEPTETYYSPLGVLGHVRFRVEIFQMTEGSDVHPAGGMFFDVPLADQRGTWQAWYGGVELQA